ncbi:hypothetical protein GF373_02380 [bacterium]|nr:hypothetical protein [bacterium]
MSQIGVLAAFNEKGINTQERGYSSLVAEIIMAKRKKKQTQKEGQSTPGSNKPKKVTKEPKQPFSFLSFIALALGVYLVCLAIATIISFGTLFDLSQTGYSVLGLLQLIGSLSFGIAFVSIIYWSMFKQQKQD